MCQMVSLSRKRISADFGGNIFWITQCHNMCQNQWPIKISTCSMYLLLCNFIEHLPKHEGQKTTLKERERETAWAEHVTPSSFFWFSFNFWMFFIPGHKISKNAVVVQLPHHVQFFATPWTAARQVSLSLTVSWSLPKFMFIASVMPSSHLILWHPPLLLPSIFASIRDCSNEFTSEDQNTGASASASVLSVNIQGWSHLKVTGLISCVQGTFRSLLQHHSLKASILWHSAFFTVQLSQLYVITGKTIALTVQTFIDRVMPLLFNTLSRFVISFLPRNNHLLISWLQSPSAMILELKKRTYIYHYFYLFPFYLPCSIWGQMPWF